MSLIISEDHLDQHVGEEIGVTEWFEIDQQRVADFADATLDHQFIHLDAERAAAETPFGGTIVHGFLTLSLLPYLMNRGCGIEMADSAMLINYGLDKVRFLQPVKVGKRVRGRSKLASAEQKKPGQFLFRVDFTVEIEGEERPALIAEWLAMIIK